MNKIKVCIVGLGYVGLPLAIALRKHYGIIGFDINKKRVEELKKGFDSTREISENALKEDNLMFTSNSNDIKKSNFIIVEVPTPIDKSKRPDLSALKSASKIVGENKGPVFIK